MINAQVFMVRELRSNNYQNKTKKNMYKINTISNQTFL